MHKLPNLYRNRLGTYYLRITVAGREIKRSLRTKEPAIAKRLALSFALARASGVVDLGVGRVQPSGHVSETTESVAPAYTDTGRCNLRGLGIQDFGVASEKLMASTHTEGDMFHIPSGISRFDVQLPNGVKLLGITDDSEAQRAARFLLDLLSMAPNFSPFRANEFSPPWFRWDLIPFRRRGAPFWGGLAPA